MIDVDQYQARDVIVQMISAADNKTGLTGLTVFTLELSKGAGALATVSRTVTAIGKGLYKVELTAADFDTAGDCALHVEAAGANQCDRFLNVRPSTVLRRFTATAGAASSITLDVGAPTTVDFYLGALVVIVAGTGAGQVNRGTAYSAGRVLAVEQPWAVVPDATSVCVLLPGQRGKELTNGRAEVYVGAIGATPVADIADGVYDEDMTGHTGTIVSRLDVATSSRAAPGAAMDLVAGAAASAGIATAGALGAVAGAVAALPSAGAVATAVWTSISEGLETYGDAIRLIGARLFGKATVQDGDGTYTFRDKADTKPRLTMSRTGTARTTSLRDGT